MKKYVLTLALMVLCACAVIVLVADYQPQPRKWRGFRKHPPGEPELPIERIVDRVGPAVVAIEARERKAPHRYRNPLYRYLLEEERQAERGRIGAGVIIDPEGYAVTNEHVVGRAREILVTLADGRRVEGVTCAVDQERDLALIKLAGRGMPAAELGDSEGLKVGQWVVAFGNPFGTALESTQPTVTVGVISAVKRNLKVRSGRVYHNLIQTDAPINSGNNGGPLVDLHGRVIGLNTLIVTSSGASTGMGFAIPSALIAESLEELRTRCGDDTAGART